MAGDPESASYGNLLPLTTSLIIHVSSFNGLWSHIKLSYTNFLSVETLKWLINSIVSVDSIPV